MRREGLPSQVCAREFVCVGWVEKPSPGCTLSSKTFELWLAFLPTVLQKHKDSQPYTLDFVSSPAPLPLFGGPKDAHLSVKLALDFGHEFPENILAKDP